MSYLANLTLIIASIVIVSFPVVAQENCDTPLARIAKVELDKAVAQHQGDACAGLRWGNVGIDKTKKLELLGFSLCESGLTVKTSIKIRARCASGGFIHVSIEDDLTAVMSADLATCSVDADIQGGKKIVQAGLALGNVRSKLQEEARKLVAPYCK